MGKWIVQQMPKDPPATMPKLELACPRCDYRVRYDPGFDAYQPLPAGQFACPFCGYTLFVVFVEGAPHAQDRAEEDGRKRVKLGGENGPAPTHRRPPPPPAPPEPSRPPR